MIYVQTPSGVLWHFADSSKATRCYCGVDFSAGFDEISTDAPDAGATCASCAAALVRRTRRREGAAALERMPAHTSSAAGAVATLRAQGESPTDDDFEELDDGLDDFPDDDEDDYLELEMRAPASPQTKARKRKSGPRSKAARAAGGELIIENGQKRWRPLWA